MAIPGWLERWRRRAPTDLEAMQAYAVWAPSYEPCAHNELMELEQRAVLELLPDPAGRAALDLGCGSGRYLRLLLARGATRVIGLDLSPDMLQRAREVTGRLVRGDARALPLASCSVDLIVCGLVVEDVSDVRGVVAEMARVLAPGGSVVYSDIHPVWTRAGWRRTFRGCDGRAYAVRHYSHSYRDHDAACRAAGLMIESVCEPRIDFEHERRGWPAALVIRARRSC